MMKERPIVSKQVNQKNRLKSRFRQVLITPPVKK